jgi:hypothetical protein
VVTRRDASPFPPSRNLASGNVTREGDDVPDEATATPTPIETLEELSLDTCSACGHFKVLHDAEGCFADPRKPNQNRPSRRAFPGEPRMQLLSDGRVCWCETFTAGTAEGQEQVIKVGDERAIQRLLLSACDRKDEITIARAFNAYITRVPESRRDPDLTLMASRHLARTTAAVTKKQHKVKPANPFKVEIATIKAEHPAISARDICKVMDRRNRFALETWSKKSKDRTWAGNFSNPSTHNLVKVYISKIPAAAS